MKIVFDDGLEFEVDQVFMNKIRAMAKKPATVEEFRVPENIKFESICGNGDWLGIVFNNGKQKLYWSLSNEGINCVNRTYPGYSLITQPKLIETPVEELEKYVGYTFLHTNYDDMRNSGNLNQYCKYLGKGEYVYIEGEDVLTRNNKWKYWYRVVVD